MRDRDNQRNVGMHGGYIPTLDASSDRMGDSAVIKKLAAICQGTFANERDVRHTIPPTIARRRESLTTLIVLTP
jgi:hypothetical protein